MATQLWRKIRAFQQLLCQCRSCLHPSEPLLPETWTHQIEPPTKQVTATFSMDPPAVLACAADLKLGLYKHQLEHARASSSMCLQLSLCNLHCCEQQ